MAKNWEQILSEVGKVSPEQTIADENELKAEIGKQAFQREYLRVAQMKAKERFTSPIKLKT